MRIVNLLGNYFLLSFPGLGFHALEEVSQATGSEWHPVTTALEMNLHDLAASYRISAHDGYAVFVFGHNFVCAHGFMVFVAGIATISGITELQLPEPPY